jgi:hypothetical protein
MHVTLEDGERCLRLPYELILVTLSPGRIVYVCGSGGGKGGKRKGRGKREGGKDVISTTSSLMRGLVAARHLGRW